MLILHDLAPEFHAARSEGYIRVGTHPSLPLTIANYTEKAVYEREWNQTTLNCRGLIYDSNTYEVVARPFPKFFNVGEPDAPPLDPDEWVVVTDKLDGSLIIAFWYKGKWEIASRGSFTSEQAEAARRIVSRPPDTRSNPGYTYLYEVIYPENRIVLDYGKEESLNILARVHNETGEITAIKGTSMLAAEALALPDRENSEGYVIYGTNHMWKIKQQDYIEKHRIEFGLNARVVWQWLIDGEFDQKVMELPDELQVWAETKRDFLEGSASIAASLAIIFLQENGHRDRKEYAEIVTKHHPKSAYLLFKALDGYDRRALERLALFKLKPSGTEKPSWLTSDDI
jgi:RNA ligase